MGTKIEENRKSRPDDKGDQNSPSSSPKESQNETSKETKRSKKENSGVREKLNVQTKDDKGNPLMALRGARSNINATKLKNAFDRRSFVISTAMGGLGVLLAARMAYLSIGENEKYRVESESNRVNLTLIPPRRGWILDRNGAPLASNRADFRVDIIPERMSNPDRTIDQLGELLELFLGCLGTNEQAISA